MMQLFIASFLLITIPFANISHPHEEDPYTTYIQEKLIDFGGGDVTSAGGADIFVLKLNSSGGGIE